MRTILIDAGVVAAVLLIPAAPVRGAAWTTLIRAVVQFGLYAACVGLGLALRRRIVRGGR